MATYKRTSAVDAAYQKRGRVVRREGIYLGYVKDNSDAQRMGRLKVWIPDFGSKPNDKDSWVTVTYVSPFAGATDPNIIDNNTQKAGGSQTSYGWWAVPPDLENQVIVSFINGDPSRGVWLGCLYQQYMNHMVPGAAAAPNYGQGQDVPVAEYNKKTSENVRNDITRPELTSHSEGLAVQGLVNDPLRGITYSGARRSEVANVYGFITPGPTYPNDPADDETEVIAGVQETAALPGGLSTNIPSPEVDTARLAGAMEDIQSQVGDALSEVQGALSSAKLPSISAGGGLPSLPSIPSIPSPPPIPEVAVPGADVAIPSVDDVPTVEAPKINTDLAAGQQDVKPGGTTQSSPSLRRRGGWQFYFDDEEGNEHMRIRSRNGSQLLIDDSAGIIYAINRAGTSWIQMDGEGNFDIFAAKSVSVRSQEDINFRADRDVNIEAGRNIRMKATNDFLGTTDGSVGAEDEGTGGGNIRMEALLDLQTIVKRNHNTQITEGSQTTLIQAGSRSSTIAGSDQVSVTGAYLLQAGGDGGMNIGGNFVTSASAYGVGSGNINIDLDGSLAAGGNLVASAEVFGKEVYSSKATLSDLHEHTHKYIDTVSGTGPVKKDTEPFKTSGDSTSVAGPTAGEATTVNAFDPLTPNTKTNVLATFSDDENLTRDTQEGVLTLAGRFLTFEPCPDHINKGVSGDTTST